MHINDDISGSFWAILLFGLLVTGILGVVVARAKNRTAAEGFWFGFLLGPLGLLLIALLPTRELGDNEYRKCPYCAEQVRSDAVLCRYCGKDLPPLEISDSSAHVSAVSDSHDESAVVKWIVVAVCVGMVVFFFLRG